MNLEKGDRFWHVYAFPDTGDFYITEYVFEKYSVMELVDVPSITTTTGVEISMRDGNIIPNDYNCHRVFDTSLAAINYTNNNLLWRPKAYSLNAWNNGGFACYLQDTEDLYV